MKFTMLRTLVQAQGKVRYLAVFPPQKQGIEFLLSPAFWASLRLTVVGSIAVLFFGPGRSPYRHTPTTQNGRVAKGFFFVTP